MRAALAVLVFCKFCAPVSAQERLAWAPADRVELVYDVFAGGRVAELALEFGLSGSHYSIAARQSSAGVLRWIWSWESVAHVRGRFSTDGVQPDAYRVLGQSRGKSRKVAIDYRDGDPTLVTVEPTNRSDGREDVPVSLRRNTVDPVSAIMSVLRRINDGAACDARVPVFDGRQRYDIVFRDSGVQSVEANSISIFSGSARLCEFHWVPIAGRTKREGAPQRPEDDRRVGRAYVARFGDGPAMAPVRVEFEAWFGTVVGHLREVRRVETTNAAN